MEPEDEKKEPEGGEEKPAGDDDKKPAEGDDPKKEDETKKGDGVKFGDDKDYELKLPKDSQLSEADQKRLTEYAKKQGLKKEAAQELLDAEETARKGYIESAVKERQKLLDSWVKETKNDKEIGGDNYNATVEQAKRVVKRFGTDEFVKELDESGYGNHKEVLRIFSRIGKAMDDDSFVEGKGGNEDKEEKSVAEKFYGKTKD